MGKQLLVFVFAVCAAIAGWSQSPAQVSADSATIYLYLPKDSFELNYRFRVNSGPRFNMRSAEAKEIKVPVGLVEVSARRLGMAPGIYSFFVEAGSTHYLRVHNRSDNTDLMPSIEMLEVTKRMLLHDLALQDAPQDNIVASEQNTATVYLYRPKYSRLRPFNVQINDQAPLKLKRQQVDTLHLPPGQYVFRSSGFSYLDGYHTLHLRAGEVVYLRLHEDEEIDRLRNRLAFVEVTAGMFRRDPR